MCYSNTLIIQYQYSNAFKPAMKNAPEKNALDSSGKRNSVTTVASFLKWCGYTLEFVAESDGQMPSFPGSAIRGAFGRSLKRLVCVMRLRPCEGCPLEFTCLYTTVFETRQNPSVELTKRLANPPHPFVLKVAFLRNRRFRKGDRLTMGVNFFGSTILAAPFVLSAFDRAGEHGLGADRLRFRLASVFPTGRTEEWYSGCPYPRPEIQEGAPKVQKAESQFRLTTPMRILSGGKLLDHNELRPDNFAMQIFRRLMLLTKSYGHPEHLKVSNDMKCRAQLLRFSVCDLSWKRLQRYSSRQSVTHSISGLVGTVGIDFHDAPEWGEILAWAPIIHAGKGTAMGLGRLEPV